MPREMGCSGSAAGAGAIADESLELKFQALVEEQLDRAVAIATHMLGDRELAKDVAQDAFFRAYRSGKVGENASAVMNATSLSKDLPITPVPSRLLVM